MALITKNFSFMSKSRQQILSIVHSLRDTQKKLCSRVVEVPIPSTGTLQLTKFPSNLHLKPVSPFEAQQNKISVSVDKGINKWEHADEIYIAHEEGVVTLKLPESYIDSRDTAFKVHIPLKYDINISMEHHASVTLEKLESESISVETAGGTICLKGTKASSNNLISKYGNILLSGAVYGNCYLATSETGNIRASKIQGEKAHFECSEDVEIEDLYCGSFTSTFIRNLRVKNFHGFAELVGHSIEIKSVLGSFNITASNVKVGIDRLLADSHIASEGDVKLDLSNQINMKLFLCAPLIDIDCDIDIIDHDKPEDGKEIITCGNSAAPDYSVHITSSTQIVIRKTNWFQNLNLI